MKNYDEQRLEQDCRNKVKAAEGNVDYKNKFVEMISDFASMTDGHLGRIKLGKHRVELSQPKTKLIHSAPYRTCAKAGKFEKNEIGIMLSEGAIEQGQTEWSAKTMFALKKKNGSVHLCLNCWNLNGVRKQGDYPISRMHVCINLFGEEAVFSTLDDNSRY